MKTEIIPSDSRYVPLTQQKWCCVPTCIQMVMIRRNIPLVAAELIGYHMGLIVPEDNLKFFWNARTGERPPAGYGTQAGKKEYAPNAMFKKLKIPLTMSWSLINKFKTKEQFVQYLCEFGSSDIDVLLCYDWGKLFDDPTYQGGHVCVLDKVDTANNTVRFIDPSLNAPKWQTVSIDKLYDAMMFHTAKNSGGFWEIREDTR